MMLQTMLMLRTTSDAEKTSTFHLSTEAFCVVYSFGFLRIGMGFGLILRRYLGTVDEHDFCHEGWRVLRRVEVKEGRWKALMMLGEDGAEGMCGLRKATQIGRYR